MKSGLILLLFVVIVVAGANDNNDSTGVKCKTENCPKTRFPSTKTTNLISITNEAEKISRNFTQLKNDASAVTEKINRISKMLESGKSDVQVRVFVSGLTAKSKSASSLKTILDGIKLNIQQVKKIANLVNEHKNSIDNDDHSKLIRFSANLNKHIKDIEKIQKLLEPATFKLSSVAVNTKHARFQFGEPVKTIKNIFESLNELLSKILADFADFVRNFGLGTSGSIDKDPTPSVIECPSGGYLYSFPGSYGRSLTCHADEMEVLNVISNKSGTRINLQVDGKQFCTVTEDSYDPEDPEDPLNIIQCRHAKSTKQSAFERIKNVDGTVSFKCSNSKYLSNPKGRDLSCMANKVTETEKFKVKQPPKDNVSKEPTFAVIKCHNGGFLRQ
ncbi:hypothetical protein M3Y97_01055500 [Aphelenchoides bicaudatus]|nr:hypothetical protein M3Y97_01055500 [Aphelenchoides bicaudatus]